MALVLAIDPDRTHHAALDRLTRDLAGHEIVVVSSADEALAVMDRRVPDLVVLPLVLAPSDERILAERLRALPFSDRVQTLTLPLVAAESAESGTESPRWFFWFRPRDDDGPAEARVSAGSIRASVERERASRYARVAAPLPEAPVPVAARPAPQPEEARPAPVPTELPAISLPPPAVAASAAMTQVEPNVEAAPEGALEPEPAVPVAWHPQTLGIAESQPSRLAAMREAVAPAIASASKKAVGAAGRALGAAVRFARSAPRRVAEIPKRSRPDWIDSVQVSRTRWLRFAVVPAILLAAAVPLVSGIPGYGAWFGGRSASGIADLQSAPSGSEVFIDGKSAGVTPVSVPLASGAHQVEFRYRGDTTRVSLDIHPGVRTVHRVDWPASTLGQLSVTSDPAGATVMVDGQKRGVTPLTLDDLPPGQHVVILKHAAGTVRRTVKIKANEIATVEASIYSGWLALFSPVELKISEAGRPLRLDDKNQVMLSAGHHELQLVNDALGYRETQGVDVQPGEVTPVSIVPPKTSVTIMATPDGEVWIDGVKVGETPLADVPVDVGTREFLIKNATYGERRITAVATVKPLRVTVDFTKPQG